MDDFLTYCTKLYLFFKSIFICKTKQDLWNYFIMRVKRELNMKSVPP